MTGRLRERRQVLRLGLGAVLWPPAHAPSNATQDLGKLINAVNLCLSALAHTNANITTITITIFTAFTTAIERMHNKFIN